jgi:hypothetical protein
MIVDAFLKADQELSISCAINDPEQYMYLTDSILKDIERSKSEVSQHISAHMIDDYHFVMLQQSYTHYYSLDYYHLIR